MIKFYVLVLSILVTSIIGNASGQSNEQIATILELDPLPPKAVIGESMYFSGHIKTVDGKGLADMPIEIWAIHDKGAFILLETVSDNEGNFGVEWIIENEGIRKIGANFGGNENYQSSSTEDQKVDFKRPGIIETEIELNPVIPVMISGKSEMFSGYLKTDDGKAIPDARIIIEGYNSDSFEIANAVTDSSGFFQTEGNVQNQVSDFFQVTAYFKGEGSFETSYSDFYDIKFISEPNGILLDKEEYYFNENIMIIGAFREQSYLENPLVKIEIIDPIGTVYDSRNVTLRTDGTFSDELTIDDGLTGRYVIRGYLNDDSLTTEFLLLNKAEARPDLTYGPFCASKYIQDQGGTIVADIAMIGRIFTLNYEDETFDVVVYNCGNTVESLAFNQHDRYIIIKGVEHEKVEVILPSRLIDGDFTIFGDDGEKLVFELLTPEEYSNDLGFELSNVGEEYLSELGLELLMSEDINVIRIDGSYSETITIQGTTAIPEFPVHLILVLSIAVTLIVTRTRLNHISSFSK